MSDASHLPGVPDPSAVAGDGNAARGSLPVFKRLRRGRVETVPHGRRGFPSVDVYQLVSFQAVTSADEMSDATEVQFYVYHTSDGSARVRRTDGGAERVTVASSEDPWHIPFEDALRMAGVEYDDDTHLGDVVVDFWSALFSPPSDPFDENSYGVSPWLERNVGDRRTVRSMRPGGGGGEWDDLRLRFRPRKTLNWPAPSTSTGGGDEPGLRALLEAVYMWLGKGDEEEAKRMAMALCERMMGQGGAADWRETDGNTARSVPAPQGVEVLQLDLDTVGLRLLDGGPDEVAVMVVLR